VWRVLVKSFIRCLVVHNEMEVDRSFLARGGWHLAIKGLVILGVGVALVSLARQWGHIHVEFSHPWLLVPAVVFQALSIIAAAVAWRHALWLITRRRLHGRLAVAHIGILLVTKYIPGKVWGYLGRGLALKDLGLASGQIATATLMEQMAFFLSGGGAMVFAYCQTWWFWMALLASMILLFACPWGSRGLARIALVIPGRWGRVVAGMGEGTAQLCSRNFLVLCGMSVWQWIFNSAVLVCIMVGVGVDLSASLLQAALIAVPAAIILGILFILVPGGIGIREGVLVFYLEPVIGLERAFMVSIVFRGLDTVRDVVLGTWSMNRLRR